MKRDGYSERRRGTRWNRRLPIPSRINNYLGERESACVFTLRRCLSTTRRNSRSIILNASCITFAKRLVRSVIDLFFFRDQLVAGRDGNINPHPELVSFFVSVIRLLDSNVAPADVIAKFV